MNDMDGDPFGVHIGEREIVDNDVGEFDSDGDDKSSRSSSLGTDDSRLSDQWRDLSPDMDSALTSLASRLCDACQELCRSDMKVEIDEDSCGWKQRGELEYHPSLSSLSESVHAGCPLCKEMSESLEERLNIHFDVRDNVTDSWSITCSVNGTFELPPYSKGLCFRFSCYDSSGKCVDSQIGGKIFQWFYPAQRLGLGPEYLEHAPDADKSTHTPNIALAKYWLDKCANRCIHQDEARSRFLPSWLVEVRAGGGTSSNLVVRLCEAEEFSQDASYLTLSHCWGGNSSLMLTKGNLEAFRRDIPVHEVPVLLKDALYITSQLGVKYIWIDCLCILQDCRDDWEYEAARMGDVYQYAKCNIAASGYGDGKTSLFKERTPIPLLNFPLCVDRTLVANNETAAYSDRIALKGIYIRSEHREFDGAVTRGPLNSRGWVAQERALSPRILHFTPKQMWWECRDHILSESFSYMDFARNFEFSSNPLHYQETGESQDKYMIWKWNKFMGFYAGTDLTVWSDRFPALIGIARKFATMTTDNLVAGFWEKGLIPSLAWRVSDDGHAKRIPHEQLAPSWSWAFLCIPHEPGYFHIEGELLSTCRGVLSDDPEFKSDLHYKTFGKSKVRGLEIRGPLTTLPVEPEGLGALPEWADYDLTVHVYYDVADKSFFSATDIADEAWQWLWEKPTHMLPLIKDGEVVEFDLTCLLLSQVAGLEHYNTFRRVGVVKIHFKNQETCNEALGMTDGNGSPGPNIVFEDCGMHDLILI